MRLVNHYILFLFTFCAVFQAVFLSELGLYNTELSFIELMISKSKEKNRFKQYARGNSSKMPIYATESVLYMLSVNDFDSGYLFLLINKKLYRNLPIKTTRRNK